MEERQTPGSIITWTLAIILVGLLCFGVLIGASAAWRKYSIWSKEQKGKATLAEAVWDRQVKTEEAKANLESERLNAQAEVERAKGAAEAISIEGGGLTENYIRYLWVRQQDNNQKSLIYIPTEAGLPILEAGKR